MLATLPHNRLGYDSPPPVKLPLPATAHGRGLLWSDAVFEAVLTLKNQLASRSEAVAAAAANSILELERTRMRHDKTVAGTRVELEPALESVATPVIEIDDSDPATLSEHIAEVREYMAKVIRRPMGEAEAKVYVVEKLECWQVRPSQIHPGEFVKMLGLMDELPGSAGPRLSASAR